jgi:hypothetical protein
MWNLRQTPSPILRAVMFSLLVLAARPSSAQAPNVTGYNAVYNSSGSTTSSPSFIDASVSQKVNHTDMCATIYNILTSAYPNPAYPTAGAVIDARGISGSALTCAAGTTPWNNGATTVSAPANILLPAGTIVIPTPWVLPPQTHLIGQGDNPSSGTVIQACTSTPCTNSFSGTAMIQFGASSCAAISCPGESVEKLILDGQGRQSGGSYISGIVNQSSVLSYVDHVSLYQILGTGLSISGSASNSGPYTNINFDTGGYSGLAGTVCASINGLTNTRGIRGLSCTSRTTMAIGSAVLLDSPSNLVKDVTIMGFHDGILVGANAPAQSNVLVNIIGDTAGCTTICTAAPVRAIHISSNQTNNSPNVQDLSILGVGNDMPSGTYTIWDDLTGAEISDAFVGLYVLGKSVNNGYARFTTSPGYATWAVGNGQPSGPCAQGSLYSCTNATAATCDNFALWGCPVGSGGKWKGIK